MIGLSLYSLRHRKVPGALAFALLVQSIAIWVLVTILEISSGDSNTKILWYQVKIFWQTIYVTVLLVFTLEYAGHPRWLTPRMVLLLSTYPVLMLLLISTNAIHHGFWSGFWVEESVIPIPGSAYWIISGFNLLWSLLPALVLIWLFIRLPRRRVPIALILCALISTRVIFLLGQAGWNPVAPLNPLVLLSAPIAILYALALFRFRLLDILPIARAMVLAQMSESVLVLDRQGCIVDLNRSAEKTLGVLAATARGRKVSDLPGCAEWRWLSEDPGSPPEEIRLDVGGSIHYYQPEVSPIEEANGHLLGHVILLHDVTAQKQAQAEILEQQRLVAAMQEREHLARDLHDDLAQTLAFLNVQAQAIHELLDVQNTALADERVLRLASVAREAHANLRVLISRLRTSEMAEFDFIPLIQAQLDSLRAEQGIQAEFCQTTLPPRACEPHIQGQLFHILQEALNNIRKHAGATQVQIQLSSVEGQLCIVIEDNGCGFDPDTAVDQEHLGLRMMRERVAELGGHIQIHSAAGRGTRITVEIPVRAT